MNDYDFTKHVNLRYGVDNAGNTVIGPTRPNGSVNPSPDTEHGEHSGYLSGCKIRGFSQIQPPVASTTQVCFRSKEIQWLICAKTSPPNRKRG